MKTVCSNWDWSSQGWQEHVCTTTTCSHSWIHPCIQAILMATVIDEARLQHFHEHSINPFSQSQTKQHEMIMKLAFIVQVKLLLKTSFQSVIHFFFHLWDLTAFSTARFITLFSMLYTCLPKRLLLSCWIIHLKFPSNLNNWIPWTNKLFLKIPQIKWKEGGK